MDKKYIRKSLDTKREPLHLSDDEKRFAIIYTATVNDGQTIIPVLTVHYQYDNHLGSACLELDELGAIISYEEYYPFGTTSYRSGRTETEVSLKRYKYCGKERDEETGLYYYGMRYYAAWICRFVSVDPLQFKYLELTPFQYASGNPITMIDLDGMEGGKPEKITIAAKNAVAKVKASDNGSEPAKCNIGVNYAFTEITGSNELSGKRANEMADYMASSSNFTPIDISDVQNAANRGNVVIAAYKAPKGSGHVALVVPGTALKTAGSWNYISAKDLKGGIPMVMDTGFNMRNESKSVNYSFGKSIQSKVIFYIYTPKATSSDSINAQTSSTNVILSPTDTTQTLRMGDQYNSEIKVAPDPKLSDRLLEYKAPIVQDIGRLLGKIGF